MRFICVAPASLSGLLVRKYASVVVALYALRKTTQVQQGRIQQRGISSNTRSAVGVLAILLHSPAFRTTLLPS